MVHTKRENLRKCCSSQNKHYFSIASFIYIFPCNIGYKLFKSEILHVFRIYH
jgi:hypothetical protein